MAGKWAGLTRSGGSVSLSRGVTRSRRRNKKKKKLFALLDPREIWREEVKTFFPRLSSSFSVLQRNKNFFPLLIKVLLLSRDASRRVGPKEMIFLSLFFPQSRLWVLMMMIRKLYFAKIGFLSVRIFFFFIRNLRLFSVSFFSIRKADFFFSLLLECIVRLWEGRRNPFPYLEASSSSFRVGEREWKNSITAKARSKIRRRWRRKSAKFSQRRFGCSAQTIHLKNKEGSNSKRHKLFTFKFFFCSSRIYKIVKSFLAFSLEIYALTFSSVTRKPLNFIFGPVGRKMAVKCIETFSQADTDSTRLRKKGKFFGPKFRFGQRKKGQRMKGA